MNNPTGGDSQAASGGRRKDPPGAEGLVESMIRMVYALPNQPSSHLVAPIPRVVPESIRRIAVESFGFEYRRPSLVDFAVNLGRLVAR